MRYLPKSFVVYLVLKSQGQVLSEVAKMDMQLNHHSAEDGLLYPLEKGFFFLPKPPTLILHEEVSVYICGWNSQCPFVVTAVYYILNAD